MADLYLDPVAENVLPEGQCVSFRGWLGAGSDENTYYLWTSSRLDERFELTAGVIVFQVPGSQATDGASTIWVRRDAEIVKTQFASAIEFADAQLEDDGSMMPMRYPKY
jgi:hypothetical protein